MKKITAIVRPEKLEPLKEALFAAKVSGMTISQVHGCGAQHGWSEYVRGTEVMLNMVPKVKFEVVVEDDAVDALVDGSICEPDAGLTELHDALLKGASWHRPDHHFLLLDFAAYQAARLRAYMEYKDEPRAFARKCLLNIAGAGPFSADRAVRQYAENIWRV